MTSIRMRTDATIKQQARCKWPSRSWPSPNLWFDHLLVPVHVAFFGDGFCSRTNHLFCADRAHAVADDRPDRSGRVQLSLAFVEPHPRADSCADDGISYAHAVANADARPDRSGRV